MGCLSRVFVWTIPLPLVVGSGNAYLTTTCRIYPKRKKNYKNFYFAFNIEHKNVLDTDILSTMLIWMVKYVFPVSTHNGCEGTCCTYPKRSEPFQLPRLWSVPVWKDIVLYSKMSLQKAENVLFVCETIFHTASQTWHFDRTERTNWSVNTVFAPSHQLGKQNTLCTGRKCHDDQVKKSKVILI